MSIGPHKAKSSAEQTRFLHRLQNGYEGCKHELGRRLRGARLDEEKIRLLQESLHTSLKNYDKSRIMNKELVLSRNKPEDVSKVDEIHFSGKKLFVSHSKRILADENKISVLINEIKEHLGFINSFKYVNIREEDLFTNPYFKRKEKIKNLNDFEKYLREQRKKCLQTGDMTLLSTGLLLTGSRLQEIDYIAQEKALDYARKAFEGTPINEVEEKLRKLNMSPETKRKALNELERLQRKFQEVRDEIMKKGYVQGVKHLKNKLKYGKISEKWFEEINDLLEEDLLKKRFRNKTAEKTYMELAGMVENGEINGNARNRIFHRKLRHVLETVSTGKTPRQTMNTLEIMLKNDSIDPISAGLMVETMRNKRKEFNEIAKRELDLPVRKLRYVEENGKKRQATPEEALDGLVKMVHNEEINLGRALMIVQILKERIKGFESEVRKRLISQRGVPFMEKRLFQQ